jgi:phenylacetaldehyde dehydrogenase
MTAGTTGTTIPGQARSPRINEWLASLQPALLIGNQWVPARSGATFETINPATGKVLATVAEGGAADVDEAVRVARTAFEEGPWARPTAARSCAGSPRSWMITSMSSPN